MADPLDGARLKLRRAWDQFNGLVADMRAFLGNQPSPYVPRVHFNAKERSVLITAHIQKIPDPMWGVRIGEIVHNLRSALDHLVWELVILSTGRPPTLPTKNQFPIFRYQDGFSGRGVRAQLRRVRQDAIDLIQAEQPFHTGEDINSPLWHLHELSNADKHRTLHVTGTLLDAFNVKFPPLNRHAKPVHHLRRNVGPIQEDAVIAGVSSPDFTEWPFINTQVECKLSMDIAFDHRTPAVGGWLVSQTLVDVTNRTERIARRIANEIFKTEL